MSPTPLVEVRTYRGVTDAAFVSWRGCAYAVAEQLADIALIRDRENRNPHNEIRLLRDTGLLGFAAPAEFGGAGGSLAQALKLGRIISAADGSIGQLINYHYSNGVWSYALGTSEQGELTARGVGERGCFQGSVSNPRDSGFRAALNVDGGYTLTRTRAFDTGIAIVDFLTVGFFDGPSLVHGRIPPDRPGLSFHDDWDNLGNGSRPVAVSPSTMWWCARTRFCAASPIAPVIRYSAKGCGAVQSVDLCASLSRNRHGSNGIRGNIHS